MPGKLKVRIVSARDLPVMDRASELTDAFAEIKFKSTTFKTEVCRKSLNPQWNSEWYRFEVDDEDLQDEPLQIRVLDHDTYSAHDAIGKVYIDLNPLLMRRKESVISGWYPIYDTMHGIRGQLHIIVKVDLFSDSNKFRQSSCGVRFFCTSGVPHGYHIETLHGFVEELVVNDDPEYQWIDKIRSMRASNEARQIQFSKLSGQVQRKIGIKVLEMGANAVIGYRQCFDLEGESGIVVRSIGTAVCLRKLVPHTLFASPQSVSPNPDFPSISCEDAVTYGQAVTSSAGKQQHQQHVRHSSGSEVDTPPKVEGAFSETPPKGVLLGTNKLSIHRPAVYQESIDSMEYPFFTVRAVPPDFIIHLGGVVSARSVKLLDRIHNPDDPETRDVWWGELRTEIRSHMRAMGCHAVLGYSEQTSIRDELIILSAIGTAAIVKGRGSAMTRNRQHSGSGQQALLGTPGLDRMSSVDEVLGSNHRRLQVDVALANEPTCTGSLPFPGSVEELSKECSICHIPYQDSILPFPIRLNRCAVCGLGKVPDVLFTTIEPPKELPIVGRGCFIQARLCRQKRDLRGEANAKDISDSLPFVEYELHKQLLNKLKVKGMNSLFRLKIQIGVGLTQLIAVATATGVYSAPLPSPAIPHVIGKCDTPSTDSCLTDVRKKINDAVTRNRNTYGLQDAGESDGSAYISLNESEEISIVSESKSSGDTCILEIDDAEDAQIVSILIDPPVPEGFDVCNTEVMPGIPNLVSNLQMFTKVWRGQISAGTNVTFSGVFDSILKSICFKLRMMTPCVLCHLDFDLDLSDEDEIQVSVTGLCVGVGEPPEPPQDRGLSSLASLSSRCSFKRSEQELDVKVTDTEPLGTGTPTPSALQPLSEVSAHLSPTQAMQARLGGSVSHPSQGQLSRSDAHSCTYSLGPTPKGIKQKKLKYHSSTSQRRGIELTPLSYIPGARIEHYTGHLNFFIIRETTSVREEGGLNGFMHSFLAEVMAICRAHVGALGGNALVAYQLTECIIEDNVHKNQSQCLVNVCGDVIQAVYGIEPCNEDDSTAVQPTATTTRLAADSRLNVPAAVSVSAQKTIKAMHHGSTAATSFQI